MKSILIGAYALSPKHGSEYGIGWNFVIGVSKYFPVKVIYGTSEGKMGSNTTLTNYLLENSIPNVEVIFCKAGFLTKAFDWLNHNVANFFFIFALKSWHKDALKIVQENFKPEDFELVHQITPTGYRSPGQLWKFHKKFVLGPIGGTSSLPVQFYKILPPKSKLSNLIRDLSNTYYLNGYGELNKPFHYAKAVICATSADINNIESSFGIKCYHLRENHTRFFSTSVSTDSALRLVWVGSIDSRKALIILLKALKQLDVPVNSWKLDIVGEGPEKKKLQEFAIKERLSNQIIWHGAVPRDKVAAIFQNSDVHVLSSLMDSNPTVLLEAFENCVPTIAINKYGAKDLLSNGCGWLVDVSSIDNVVNKFSEIIRMLIDDRNYVQVAKQKILENHKDLSWDKAIEDLVKIYKGVINE